MAKEIMLYSFDGKRSVRSSKLREFRIDEWNTFGGKRFRLVGVFSSKEFFEFGVFIEEEEAKTFLEVIHDKIEGRKRKNSLG